MAHYNFIHSCNGATLTKAQFMFSVISICIFLGVVGWEPRATSHARRFISVDGYSMSALSRELKPFAYNRFGKFYSSQ